MHSIDTFRIQNAEIPHHSTAAKQNWQGKWTNMFINVSETAVLNILELLAACNRISPLPTIIKILDGFSLCYDTVQIVNWQQILLTAQRDSKTLYVRDFQLPLCILVLSVYMASGKNDRTQSLVLNYRPESSMSWEWEKIICLLSDLCRKEDSDILLVPSGHASIAQEQTIYLTITDGI